MIANDTDVFVLLLHYTIHFKERELKELWLQFGTGNYTRFVPIHIPHKKIGNGLSLLTLKLHVLTGCEVTSFIGTKKSALKAKPECFLRDFGEGIHLTEKDALNAEHYLVKVVSPSSDSLSFNQLRFELYTDKKVSLVDLPPTSASLSGHLLRCHIVIFQLMNLLKENVHINYCNYGWNEAVD